MACPRPCLANLALPSPASWLRQRSRGSFSDTRPLVLLLPFQAETRFPSQEQTGKGWWWKRISLHSPEGKEKQEESDG